MVCHWSRMRPVFSRSGRAAVVSVRSVGTSGAMKRALKSLAKKPPSAKKRACGSLPCRTGHCTGAIASKSLSESDCSAPMSKSRAPSFSNAERDACSRKISAAELKPKAAPKPRRLATSPMIHQSGFASPGAERNARCREMRLSELVTVPDFSPQASAGSSTCAPTSTVSLEMTFSETTNSSSFFRASRAASAFGSDTAGLVPITHSALISPRAIASNICTAFSPSWVAMRGAFQNRRTRSMSGGVNPMWAASWLASPPTSRPPIALGCPVSENGDAPACRSAPSRDGS